MEGLRPLFRYFEFSGRSGRSEFWKFTAFTYLASFSMAVLELAAGSDTPVLAGLINLLTMIPFYAAMTRRLHDVERSGWLILKVIGSTILLIGVGVLLTTALPHLRAPLGLLLGSGMAGLWFYLIYLLCQPGDECPNAYGDPDNGVPRNFAELRSGTHGADGEMLPPFASKRSAQSHFSDPFTQIERLGQLREKGLLTEDEFAAQKAALLAQS